MLYPQLPGVAFFPWPIFHNLFCYLARWICAPIFARKKHVPFTNPRISKVDPVMESKHMGAIFPGWWFQPLWKMMEFVSWDNYSHILWENNPNVPNQPTRSYVFPMVFLWFSYYPMVFLCFLPRTLKTSIWPGLSRKFPWRLLRWLRFACSSFRWSVMKCWGHYGKRMETMGKNMKLKCWTKHSWWMLSRSIPGFWMVDIPLRNG